MRVGFLYNHDQIHQVAHSLPVALALAKADDVLEVIVATTNDKIAAEIEHRLGQDRPRHLTLKALTLQRAVSRTLNRLFGKLLPTQKWLIYRDNLDFFRSLDVLVVTERTSLVLKTKFGLDRPKLILIDHGAGDRAIGFGASTAGFDLILAAGNKIRDRMIGEAGVNPDRIKIAGYPKFDADRRKVKPLKFADRDKPIVLYNPHVSPHLSSWYIEGRAVLDHFLNDDRYNLIFAPHIMMFERKVVFTVDRMSMAFPGAIDHKYLAAPNIHVDLASAALTNMSYTNCADIYLGDVSSQVYEFLREPRPCVFMNSHHVDHKGDANYAHWQAGLVIESADDLGEALDQSVASHGGVFQSIQQTLFDYTFDLSMIKSSVRAAQLIADFLEFGML